jgi:flagellar hook assembly protein FlgD
VVDLDRGRRLPVTNGSATVRLTPDRPARRLRVIVGTEAFAEQNSGGAPLTIDETTLRTNAPNPFRESTTISYQLAERQRVTIAIYDLLGRRVQTLVDGPRAAGVHQTTWRATGSDGQALASGVYFCRMEAGAHTSTRKLVLVR